MLYDPNNTQPPGSDSGSPPPDQPPSQLQYSHHGPCTPGPTHPGTNCDSYH